MLRPLEVILIDDETIEPPAPKMVVCVEARLGLFFRINSRRHWQIPIPLIKVPNNDFLHHDSFLECGLPLELDDYIVEDSMRRSGVIGTVFNDIVPRIFEIIRVEEDLSEADRNAIIAFLS